MKYQAMIVGGIGDDVWDEDLEIDAADFEDAAEQANGKADSRGGRVYLLEEVYGDSNHIKNRVDKDIHILERLRLAEQVCRWAGLSNMKMSMEEALKKWEDFTKNG